MFDPKREDLCDQVDDIYTDGGLVLCDGRWGTDNYFVHLRVEQLVLNIKKILLASDLGANSDRATEHARMFTSQFGAELHVLHVLEDVLVNTPSFGGGLALNSYVHESKSVVEQKIHSLFEPSWLLGKQLVAATADGNAGDQILHYAKEHSIDLIIVGTHGRSGLSHMLVGSVAEQVTRKSRCAVVVVRSRA